MCPLGYEESADPPDRPGLVEYGPRRGEGRASDRGRDRLDVSHRGGPKGFINKLPNGLLRIPDYQGNSLYNTLGNIAQSPEAGLLFIDFEQGHTLQISGTATLDFDHHEENDLVATTGTGRYWLFEPSQWVATHAQIPAYWVHQDDSPFNPTIT